MNKFEDEYNKFIKRIKEKLDNNPELKKEIDNNISRLSEIFETNVNITLDFYPKVEEYKEVINNYDDIYFKDNISIPDYNSIMKLSDLKLMLNNEEDDLYICIDPLYIKDGVNDINNMLITTINDRIILVPTIKKEE